MLDQEARHELRSLSKDTAELVARHLVMTGRLLDEDPDKALEHARAARALAGRIGVVREAAGLAAYAAGEWTEALAELRAARRITGSPEHLAVMADCERALDRPERALAYADDPEVPALTQESRVELVIVLAGARRDLGQVDAARLLLQEPARRTVRSRPWAARLWYALADVLLAAGQEDEAREWFARAAEVDEDQLTDAAERLLELDGVVFEGDADDEGAGAQTAVAAQQPEGSDVPPAPVRDEEPAAPPTRPAVVEDAEELAVQEPSAEPDEPTVPDDEAEGTKAEGAEVGGTDVDDGGTEPPPDGPSPSPVRPSTGLFSDALPEEPAAPARQAVPGVTFAPPEDDEDDLRLFE